jgi:hypothetical protein
MYNIIDRISKILPKAANPDLSWVRTYLFVFPNLFSGNNEENTKVYNYNWSEQNATAHLFIGLKY